MRFVTSLSSCGAAALAVLGFQAQAQQTRQAPGVVRPSEQFRIAPAVFAWDDLVKLQASMPRLPAVEGPAPAVALEPPLLEASLPEAPAKTPESRGSRVQPAANPDGSGIEPLLPCAGFPSEPAIGAGFDSQLDVPDGAGFSYIPPDVAGAVGPNHLMAMLENMVLIQDRLGATVSSVDLNVFWSPLGTTPLAPTTVYPRVHFDALDDRWIASLRNGVTSTGSTSIFFAISQTDDPTGTWDYYSFLADPGATSFADWVVLGYNSTWITITANMFTTPSGASFLGSKMWAIDKSTALVPGGPITVSVFPAGFMTTVHGSGGSSVHPARTLDGDPTLWMVNDGFSGGTPSTFLMQLTRITGTGAAPVVSGLAGSPFGGSTSFCFSGTAFSSTQRTMAQSGEPRFITPFSVRIASVVVRNGKIWVANSGGLPGPVSNTAPTSNGVIWQQIDPTLPFPPTPGAAGFMVLQSGGITNGANTMSMYPSIAVNCGEDVLIGYANGDSSRSPRACYSMRLGSDALGFMGAVNELKAGESTYWKNFGVGTTAQYGRYTSTAVDPNDDRTLWTLQEYADTRVGVADNDSRWGTWWGRFGDCENLPAPVVVDDPDSVAVCVGGPASFTVIDNGGPPTFTYQWRKDGVDIPGANSATYSIAATVAADGGDYDVVISGCGQELSLAATLSFTGATVTIDPVDYIASVGDPAAFFVVATGTGTLSYQWLLNGTPIPLADDDIYIIPSVVAGDYYDEYSCIVTDACGPGTSATARLLPQTQSGKHQLAELSFHIFEDPSSTIGCVGQPASFEVIAFPEGVTYEWRKDGTPIVPAETNSTLTIASVSVGDAGAYDCVVTYGTKTKTSADGVLTVYDIPTITVQPSPLNKTVSAGASLSYSVTATGPGTLHYQWRHKPATPFAPFVDIPGANSPTLDLTPVSGADAGSYRCIISNQCGAVASRVVDLIVL